MTKNEITKDKKNCCAHITSSTHERLMRRKKSGGQTFDSVIVELLDENIELKRKLRMRDEIKDDTETGDQAKTE